MVLGQIVRRSTPVTALRLFYAAHALPLSNFYAAVAHNPPELQWSVSSMAITGRRIRLSISVRGRPGSSMQTHSQAPAISARRKQFSGILSGVSLSRGAIKDTHGST